MSDKSLKVTDRRMFTPDGRLREEYRELEEKAADAVPAPEPSRPEPPTQPAGAVTESRPAGPIAAAGTGGRGLSRTGLL